jgi:hypothetical protein
LAALPALPELGQGAQPGNQLKINLRQQKGFLFFFFVFLRAPRGCNEAQRSRWTFYKVVNNNLIIF